MSGEAAPFVNTCELGLHLETFCDAYAASANVLPVLQPLAIKPLARICERARIVETVSRFQRDTPWSCRAVMWRVCSICRLPNWLRCGSSSRAFEQNSQPSSEGGTTGRRDFAEKRTRRPVLIPHPLPKAITFRYVGKGGERWSAPTETLSVRCFAACRSHKSWADRRAVDVLPCTRHCSWCAPAL